ncbi:DegT/DnrJ/EryC1/StrS aminotransferase family protein [Alphaproteobacteria bacterium]|nr:DegT/DnrJ/EryC1/StrS aminotransferase family protein [Alphaproteobacteria bacterium]
MIPFIDLKAQQNLIRNKIEERIKAVLDHGQYILGPEVKELEKKLSIYTGAKYVLCCSSGTDALLLALLGLKLKAGEGVIVPAFSFASSAEVMPLLGAIPIFIDIENETFNLDPSKLADAFKTATEMGIKVKGIMSVGLFGQPADMKPINEFAKNNNLWVLDDAAQSFGGKYYGDNVGNLCEVSATSFFPAKPLGCYGDGGAIFTNDPEIYEIANSSHVHGMGKNRYEYDRIGMNARMSTIQAAILLEKLEIFPSELRKRQDVANNYNKHLNDLKLNIKLPLIKNKCVSSWAQYTIILPEKTDRSKLQEELKSKDIPTAIYYPIPLNEHEPYKNFPISKSGLANTNYLARNVLSLPMHPYLTEDDIINISKNIHEAFKIIKNN